MKITKVIAQTANNFGQKKAAFQSGVRRAVPIITISVAAHFEGSGRLVPDL
jgi:hypothetical protein